ncbi:hypothetical protein ACMA5I_10980 [Paracoccaceae bacterium GXU_MW_L88]
MKFLSTTALALLAPFAVAAATVNLDATAPGGNSGHLYNDADGFYLDPTDGPARSADIVYLSLNAGTYNITATRDLYESWNAWRNTSGCDDDGENCTTGYRASFAFFAPETATVGANGKVDYIKNGEIDLTKSNLVNYGEKSLREFYETASQGYDAFAGMVMASFTLESAQQIGFYVHDSSTGDNRGGVSIDVSPVPLPGGFALLGLGVAGLAATRRKKRV